MSSAAAVHLAEQFENGLARRVRIVPPPGRRVPGRAAVQVRWKAPVCRPTADQA
ncbi:hypothetical protein AB0N16_40865 [Streptomyces sp. NPDC051105]|uniref:hypothetical protein n=1 Tax=Streptomyces sp. NPDC051105 TaxID=3154843 RepID=UPI003449EEC6